LYKAIIIDDESKPREVLALKIKESCPSLEIVDIAESAQEGFLKCQIHHPHIVFIDVTMPNETGFDFLRKFDSIPFEIIFATAYQEFAVDAFKVSAVGFLLKPIRTEDLVIAVNTAIDHLLLKNTAEKYKALFHNIKPTNRDNQMIVVPAGERYEMVDVDQIMYFEGSEKYTYIYAADGRKILSSQYIGKYKNMMAEQSFFITHKSYMVNLKFVLALSKEDEIILSDGHTKIPLARRRKAEFLQVVKF